MRRVPFTPAALPPGQEQFWEAWESGADAATGEMLMLDGEGKPVSPDKDTIWGALKEWFLEHVFAGKCAYCEGEYQANAPQHAEHWRPKGKVTQLVDGQEVTVERDGAPHPGYWWLAYSWENLVPACFYCNTGKGKGTKFPIAGDYVFAPDEVDDGKALDVIEQPWLLHPWKEPHPERHIGFTKDGTAYAKDKSQYGYWTITVMDLNRENLVNARRQRQKEALNAFGQALEDFARFRRPVREAMQEWQGPKAPFARAVEDRLLPIREQGASELLQHW